jgi:hypothetical protein
VVSMKLYVVINCFLVWIHTDVVYIHKTVRCDLLFLGLDPHRCGIHETADCDLLFLGMDLYRCGIHETACCDLLIKIHESAVCDSFKINGSMKNEKRSKYIVLNPKSLKPRVTLGFNIVES